MPAPIRPYQLTASELVTRLDEMVAVTFDDLTSQFMLLPRGPSFLTYEEFRDGYEVLRIETSGFESLTPEKCWKALRKNALAFTVLRTILGVSPPEWQDLTNEETGSPLPPNTARMLDGRAKRDPSFFAKPTALVVQRVTDMLRTACKLLATGPELAPDGLVHRLDKFDTAQGAAGISHAAQTHVPYAVLLYERFLGRPYASHRDAVSELVGDVMESAIEAQLQQARIPFRKTGRAERVPGFDQAPDFFIPDEIAPGVIVEAKITGDDGTARDKVARILRLAHMRDEREANGKPAYQVVACIDGRGFGVRQQDCKDLLKATRGKLFTANTLGDLISYTDLAQYMPAP
ncbi:MAG: hypothetical protein ACYCUF_08970 [Acidimicrobiales bacterium]|jgi:hypothetical protein|nr:hypothetical protein [Actinomycetota bacterium]